MIYVFLIILIIVLIVVSLEYREKYKFTKMILDMKETHLTNVKKELDIYHEHISELLNKLKFNENKKEKEELIKKHNELVLKCIVNSMKEYDFENNELNKEIINSNEEITKLKQEITKLKQEIKETKENTFDTPIKVDDNKILINIKLLSRTIDYDSEWKITYISDNEIKNTSIIRHFGEDLKSLTEDIIKTKLITDNLKKLDCKENIYYD